MPRPLTFALFLAVAIAILGGMHLYLWARLIRDPALAEPWRRGLTIAIALLAAALPLGMIGARLLPREWARSFAGPVFGWMGFAFLLFAALLALDLLRLVTSGAAWVWDAARRAPDLPPDPARRVFLSRAVAGGALLYAGGAAAAGVRTAAAGPVVVDVPVRLEKLPRALSGLTIAQITDLHVGPTIGEREVRRVVEQVNALRPDLVAITGDLVDGPVAELGRAVAPLHQLRSRYGTFFVTGNHEYFSGVGAWTRELERLGIRVLRNARVTLGDTGPGGAALDVAGVDDWSAGRRSLPDAPQGPDLDRALAGRDPERPLLLLAHQPKQISAAVAAGVDLQLSGHTHGGQIFPFGLVVAAAQPYVKGLHLHREQGAEGFIYVSPGAGYWGPPMRVGAPPEIARVVLV